MFFCPCKVQKFQSNVVGLTSIWGSFSNIFFQLHIYMLLTVFKSNPNVKIQLYSLWGHIKIDT